MTKQLPSILYSDPTHSLKRAQSALRSCLDESLKAHGMTLAQVSVLTLLRETPGLSNADLARLAFVKPQTMFSILQGLARDSLVSRADDPDHGRLIRTELTPKGRQALEVAHKSVHDVTQRMLRGMSKAEASLLVELLNRCAANLGAAPAIDE